MENTKCECGHQNHVGTVLCESCGKPLEDDAGSEPLEMRYDGVARRSQRKNPSLLDRIWGFFSSVKVAVYLIIITLCATVLGTLYPQENVLYQIDPKVYYAENYGKIGEIYHFLGLSRTYESWWFLGLLVMIGTSLVVCSLDRVLPLYRALNKQQIRKHPRFLARQKVVYSDKLFDGHELGREPLRQKQEQWLQEFGSHLKKRFYRVHVRDQALLAEKHRFSRWGPYINHIGLIIFLLAALLRSLIPGWHMDEFVSVMEGETRRLPGTDYFLKNEQFTVEFYSEEEMNASSRANREVLPKIFETRAVLYQCVENCSEGSVAEPVLEEVDRHNIRVNDPLAYEDIRVYQSDYRFTPMILSVNVRLEDRETGEVYGDFRLDTRDPASGYTAGSYELELIGYYPDFTYENGNLATESREPKAPAFVFMIRGPELEEGAVHMYFPRPQDQERFHQEELNRKAGSPFLIRATSMEDVEVALYTSTLNIRTDKGMPFIWTGAAISMIGLVMGFYWQHRRIWLRFDEGELLLGAHTNKNWFGLRKEVADALGKSGIEIDPKSLANEVKPS